ncbi:MAG: hypothetical protein ACYC6N_30600 [Pirellulaceae bacterium]
MARFTILIGLLLTLVGVGSYFYALLTGSEATGPSPTALIPAFAGVPILLLGCVALKESLRKHAMHVVALLALLGFLLPVGRLAMKLAQGELPKTTILVSLVLMAALCGILLAACVRSFVDARLRKTAD